MTDLQFREIDLDAEPTTAKAFVALVESELGGVRRLSTIKRTIDYDAGSAKIIGGFIGGELVSVNVFMRMEFLLGCEPITGYQSGFSATSNMHRGKGIWPRLLLFSESYLSDLGASFIFGFPNPISHPLFVGKLGYQSEDLYYFRNFSPPILDRYNYNLIGKSDAIMHSENVLEPRLDFNIDWKRRGVNGGSVVSFDSGDAVVWGRRCRKNKFGMNFDYFEVGGLSLSSVSDLPKLLQIATRALKAHYYTIYLNRSNVYFQLFNFREKTHIPVIIKPLNPAFHPEKVNRNFFIGLSDVY